ncbi:Peptide transporter PTR2A [Mycena venus]|uniref:Peptide transporter PTR2A n=1 Tax=Mycena venus TaxID=2733690 RepID=A0A8H6X5R5_9AGAR|nr:Peptide transporter PTR2A [Mycena venus]
MADFTSYKYEPLNIAEGDGEEYEMDGGVSPSKLHEIDGIHDGLVRPSEEELLTLRRVGDAIPWNAYLIAIVELAERFSVSAVFSMHVVAPPLIFHSTMVPGLFLPISSNIHFLSVHTPVPAFSTDSPAPWAKAKKYISWQHASTGITTSYQFWCSVTPFAGAYIADVHWGRFNTICVAVFIALVGHIILIFAAVPGVIEHPDTALLIFLVALVIMGLGTGLFKSNISPLVAEQYRKTKPFVVTTAAGERVIVDPALTISRIYMYFYLMINVGSLLGQYVGFWLAYTLPTVVFLLCPLILLIGRKRYVRSPPTGSVLATFVRLLRFASRGRWSANPVRTYRNLTAPDFWDSARPSRVAASGGRPGWMSFDDAWVDEVRKGLGACAVFMWFPIYWLTANQLNSNLTSQAATLTTNGMPNDLLSNLDPLVLVVCIPLCDFFAVNSCKLCGVQLYPALERRRIRFTPLKRIAAGFLVGAAAMGWAAVLQYNIYQTNPCGYAAATCTDPTTGNPRVSPLNVWIQAPAYILIALSEILASITGFEYAFTKAPANMRSLVMALFMGTSAMSAVLGEGFLWLAADPLLVWNYAVMGVLAGGGGARSGSS